MNSPALTAEQVERVSELTRQRYSQRYQKLGRNIRTLGWGSEDQQACRFRQTLALGLDFQDRSVIDIGCGFGDYFQFLTDQESGIREYIGYDLNANFIEEAGNRFPAGPARFSVANVLEDQFNESSPANIGVMLGLLNFHWKDTADNLTYTRNALRNAFRLVDEALVVDFLSTRLTDTWPKEDFVFYHDPVEIMQMALEITPHVVLKHDYEPIPQKEFMLVLRK